ncbi:hypothetical protein [Halochromatium salexigens]|uniref:hypothetical protein n=1 Tax=Halochromatium salexigens TaxID=49447 RepID=UPI0019132C08|nr:hypothetical protein [Halochromatium salexigens]
MKTFLVHIGAGKAGSSAIQSFLSCNRSKLASSGFHIDVPGDCQDVFRVLISPYAEIAHPVEAKIFEHPPLRRQIYHNLDSRDVLNRWRQNLSKYRNKNIIISNEGFFHSHPERNGMAMDMLRFIYEPFADTHKLKILIYFRRQDETLHSLYQQWCKGDCFHVPFSEFKTIYPPFRENRAVGPTLDYSCLKKEIIKWLDVFDIEVLVRSYDQVKTGVGLISDFKDAANITDIKLKEETKKVNQGINAWGARMLALGSSFDPPDREVWGGIVHNDPRAKIRGKKFSFLSSEERKEVMQYYYASNKFLFGFDEEEMSYVFGETEATDFLSIISDAELCGYLAIKLVELKRGIDRSRGHH